jgi:cytidylate kinase
MKARAAALKIYVGLVPIIERTQRLSRRSRLHVYRAKHTVFMKEDELNRFKQMMGWKK